MAALYAVLAAGSASAAARKPGRLLTVLSVSVAAGLTAALTSALRATGAAGAMAGVAILLAGAVVGYLAAGAVQLRALATAWAPQASRGALVTVTGRWALPANSTNSRAARRPRAVAMRPIMGKLAEIANCVIDL